LPECRQGRGRADDCHVADGAVVLALLNIGAMTAQEPAEEVHLPEADIRARVDEVLGFTVGG